MDNKCLRDETWELLSLAANCRRIAASLHTGRGSAIRATRPSKQQTRLGHVACLATDVGHPEQREVPAPCGSQITTGPLQMGQERRSSIPNICNFVRSTDFYARKPQNDLLTFKCQLPLECCCGV